MKTDTRVSQEVESQLVILLDDDAMMTDGLAAALERDGRTIITCNDVEAAELIVERTKPSHIVADIHISGPFGFEGLDFIRYVKRFSPDTKMILMSGDTIDSVQLEAAERGAVAFLGKPFDIGDLDAMLNLMACSASTSAAHSASIVRIPLLDDILVSDSLNPFFQPIVALEGRYPHVGFEALARFRGDSLFRNPDSLFAYAARKKRLADLDLACLGKAIAAGSRLSSQGLVFFNIHPEVFKHGDRLSDVLLAAAENAGLPLNRIVLEITEQGALVVHDAVVRAAEQLRKVGVRFAFDDLGVAYSHLALIDKVIPAFLKVSQSLGTGFESDATKFKIVSNILSLSREFECGLIVEGIESEATAKAAMDLGIPYGQGFLFGVPADAAMFRSGSKPGAASREKSIDRHLVAV